MKKQLLLFVMMLLPMVASADAVEIDGIYYELITKIREAKVVGGPYGYSGDIEIPSTVVHNGVEYTVTTISGFYNCESLNSVIIPNSVKTITNDAFRGCENLKSITLSNKLESIGKGAFTYCYNLEFVYISDLTAWLNIDFEEHTSNPLFCCNSKGNLKNHLYLNGKELVDLVIPNNISNIKKYSFYGCTGIKSVTIPNSIKFIEQSAFASCSGLESVHVTDLDVWYNIVFEDIYSSPLYYGHHLYINGVELKDLVIPNGTICINNYLFAGCSGLTSINIPNSVTSIGNGAFYDCSGLTSINIPNSVTEIGDSAFRGCTGFTSIIIPNSVTKIEEGTFANCTELTSIYIPNSVLEIGRQSFAGCTELKSITIPNSVTSLGNFAFGNCLKLETVIIGNAMKTIGIYYDIYYSVPGGYAFAYCPEIKNVYCWAEDVPAAQETTFESSYIEYATLHVLSTAIEAYKARVPWNSFKSVVPLTEGDPKPTGIIDVITDSNSKLEIFDLNGRKVAQPLKGLYIKNGKKYVVK